MGATIIDRFHPLIRWLFIATVIAIPLSVKFYFPLIDLEVIFPAEPLIGTLVLVLLAKFLFKRTRPLLDGSALMHPISLLVAAYLVVNIASTIGSTMALVSIKATLVRVTYVLVFYFYLTCSPQEGRDAKQLTTVSGSMLLRVHGYTFLVIVLYSLIHQFREGGGRAAAGLAPFPFYIDHTIYSAALVFVLFGSVFATARSVTSVGWEWRTIAIAFITVLCGVALYFSFCRAAWLSVLAVVAFVVLQRMGVRFQGFLLLGLAVALLLFLGRGPIMERVRANTVDSNADNAGFTESVLSLTNINTDVSNTERLNRWSCAYRMFLDRPLLGFGPGTFQFAYLPYQRPGEITYLSAMDTRDPAKIQRTWSFSDQLYVRKNPQLHYYSGGTAHSEYLLAISEGGLFAGLVLMALFLVALRTGLRLLASPSDPITKGLVLTALLGLLAYFVHGLFNNFLDDCKIAFLFWGSFGVLTTVDLAHAAAAKGVS